MVCVFMLFCFVVLVTGDRSPYARYIEELLQTIALGFKISDNILEDALLDVEGLIKKYGYPFEEYHVITEDGYILTLHRIPHGRNRNNTSGRKPVALLMHGLFCSSAGFVLMGPGSALAYVLADAGYDVWLGNARGTYYSRYHLTLNPNDGKSIYWNFSWDEIGNFDLPAMIDLILAQTGQSRLHYIGLSQGTTVFFVLGSLRPDYNKKIISMHALAPVAYIGYNRNSIFKLLAPLLVSLEAFVGAIGLKELVPRSPFFTFIGITLCSDDVIFQPLCSALILSIAGWNPKQLNTTMFPVKLGHTPAGCAARQLFHYGQCIAEGTFRRYNHGKFKNLIVYGTATPPAYDLSKLKVPVYLHHSKSDPFATLDDIERLYKEIGGPVYKVQVPDPAFSHVDFMWGMKAKKLVFDKTIAMMKSYDLQLPGTSE